jgi:hypothetical protein
MGSGVPLPVVAARLEIDRAGLFLDFEVEKVQPLGFTKGLNELENGNRYA